MLATKSLFTDPKKATLLGIDNVWDFLNDLNRGLGIKTSGKAFLYFLGKKGFTDEIGQ